MAFIYFVSTYKPIMCGIADYTEYLTNQSPAGQWSVLTFDPARYGDPLTGSPEETGDVWYGIPGRTKFDAQSIMDGIDTIGNGRDGSVVWFQHEFGIWPDIPRFVAMLQDIPIPKIISFHTIHFQSDQTRFGLRREQYTFLGKILPYVDGITVFSVGVQQAVTAAFPEYSHKVHILRHGIHSYPEIRKMSQKDAKRKLHEFLLYESDLDRETKEKLLKHRVLLDEDAVVLGQTGFLCPQKGTELLFEMRDRLQKDLPSKKIFALRVGSPREGLQKLFAKELHRTLQMPNLLAEIWLPQSILPLAQRAFDINFYWPRECTQSGVLAHALGAGALMAGRDLEGIGETLKAAGQPAETDLDVLETRIKNLIIHPELKETIRKQTQRYAEKYSWENQVKKHYSLAELVLPAQHVRLAAR